MSRIPLLHKPKEPKHLIFVTEEDGCRIPQRVRTSASMHMDTGVDGLERRISLEATARYARTPNLPISLDDTTPPALPARTPPRAQPPIPARDPLILRSVPPAPREPPPIPRTELITLAQVRSGPRAQNDYVDSPRWAATQKHPTHVTKAHHPSGAKTLQPADRTERIVGFHVPGGSSLVTASAQDLVISTQPQSAGMLKKEHVVDVEGETVAPPVCQESMICSQCGKCRCQCCTQPRELPRYWFCNNKCECSVQRMVDVCSCLCCVRALFYHCFKDSDGDEGSAADDPCACSERPHCCKRWTCLGLMSLCLACLCLYWPLRCGLYCCTSIYNKCSRKGCHCRRDRQPGSKRLLIDSESSST